MLWLKKDRNSVYGFVFSLALLPGQFLDIQSTFSIPWYPAQHHPQPWDTFYIKGSTSVGLLPRNAGLVSNGEQYPKRLRYCPMGICLKSQANIWCHVPHSKNTWIRKERKRWQWPFSLKHIITYWENICFHQRTLSWCDELETEIVLWPFWAPQHSTEPTDREGVTITAMGIRKEVCRTQVFTEVPSNENVKLW